MSSRRRSGRPRSPIGTPSAKVVPPLVAADATLPDPSPTEPVAAARDDAPIAQALLSSVSSDAVEAAIETAPASVLDPAAGGPSQDPIDAAEDDVGATASPIVATASEAPTDLAPPVDPSADATDGEGPDAIVVSIPQAGVPQATGRPPGSVSPSLAPLTEINATLSAFVRGEGAAAIAHLGALTRAASPADAIRLQVGEIQRAADASLTCFSAIMRSAHRFTHPGGTP